MAAYNQTIEANFGPAHTGLATIAYKLIKRSDGSTLLDWTTAGVSEPEAGSGGYQVLATLDSEVMARARWRASTVGPWAFEDIFPDAYQPGIAVVKNAPTIVEPDTWSAMGISIVTNAGQPEAADLTAGTVTINRIRAGASTAIVSGAACAVNLGNIYYVYTFPAASWQAGDLYYATMIGQKVTINSVVYDLSAIVLEGRITREAAIKTDTAAILADTGTDGVVVAIASKTGYALSATGLDQISAAEPTAKPTTFAGWVMWLIQRFRRADKTPTTIVVKKETGGRRNDPDDRRRRVRN
jgi:hypothetical protein